METFDSDSNLVAYCGLYCGSCGKYRRGKCPGCRKNEKAGWCKVRVCAIGHSYRSCADCLLVSDLKTCGKLNNFISKMFAFIFRSDRFAALAMIRECGYDEFACSMAKKRLMTPRRT